MCTSADYAAGQCARAPGTATPRLCAMEHDKNDDLAMAQGIMLGVAVGVLLWALGGALLAAAMGGLE